MDTAALAKSTGERVEDAEITKTISSDETVEIPEMDGINVEAGLQRLLGNKKTYCRILVKFRDEFQHAAQTVKDLVSKEKYREAQILVHSLKGAGANVGAGGFKGRLLHWKNTTRMGAKEFRRLSMQCSPMN